MSNLAIRHRERTQSSPRAGMGQTWHEVQVVEGRKVIFRCDFEHQALAWIAENRPGDPLAAARAA